MSYTIYNTDGTVLSNIAIGDIDNYSTSLTLIGKNVNNYGEYLNNNLIKLLTNSASTSSQSPASPLIGQLWYNKTANRLTVYDGISFQPTYGSHVSGVSPTTATIAIGDFWYDTVNTQLNVWDGDSFNLVGPATSGLLGTFGIVPTSSNIRDYNTNVVQRVGSIFAHGSTIGIITTASFTISPSDANLILPNSTKAYSGVPTNVVNGITIIKDLEVLGNLSINGWDVKNHATIDLTTSYDITPFGTYTATTTATTWGFTNSNFIAYNAANYAISQDLAKMFDISYYRPGSQVSVLCKYNTETSIRSFLLYQKYSQQQYPWWEPNEIIPYTWTSTQTLSQVNAINPATWAWTGTLFYSNIKGTVWNETIRTDSISSTSTSYLNPVTVNSTFYVKISNGVPFTDFTYGGVAPFTYFAGSGTLGFDGSYTTSTMITNTIQPSVTTATYTVNFAFAGTNHTRQLNVTAIRP